MIAVIALLSSCGGSDDGGQAETVNPTTTNDAEGSSSTVEEEEEAGEESTTTIEEPTAGPLAEVLVRLEDLPAGWTVATPDTDDDSSFCDGSDPLLDSTPAEEVSADYQMSDFGPFLSTDALRFGSSDEAEAFMVAFIAGINSCSDFTETEDGQSTTYTISPLSFPDLGDRSFAARMGAASPFGPLAVDFVVTREGETVLAVANGGFGTADSALTESSMRLMVERN